MRIIAVAALAIAILVSGLISHSARRATASAPEQASATVDSDVVRPTVDMKSLPEEPTGDTI